MEQSGLKSGAERRRWVAVALLLCLLSLVVAGCLPSGAPAPVAPGPSQRTARPIVLATSTARSVVTRAPDGTRTPTPRSASSGALAELKIATPAPGDHMATIKVAELPQQARDTLRLIASNGPFPYRQDGVTFENREGLLPKKPANYYHEYTVVTPGSSDRGARRLIRGQQGELYYTDDHYASFKRVTS